MQIETTVIHRNRAVVAMDHEGLDGHQRGAGRAVSGVGLRQLGADDQANKLSAVVGPKIGRTDDAAGAHHHGAIAAIIQIVELVADQDGRGAAAFQEADEAQQPIPFVGR